MRPFFEFLLWYCSCNEDLGPFRVRICCLKRHFVHAHYVFDFISCLTPFGMRFWRSIPGIVWFGIQFLFLAFIVAFDWNSKESFESGELSREEGILESTERPKISEEGTKTEAIIEIGLAPRMGED